MTKKDYVATAKLLRPYVVLANCNQIGIVTEIIEGLAELYAHDNEMFSKEKFLEACGLTV